MIIVIVRRLKATKSTMDRYLTMVAVSDTVFLLTGPFVTWSDVVIGYSLKDSYVWSCKLIAWLFNTAGTVSAWSLVAMTTQRVVSVVLPHRVNVLCTGRRSWQIIASIVVIASLFHAHMLYGMGLMTSRDAIQTTCTIVYPDYARFVLDIWIYLDICTFSFLPFVCLIVGNTVLVYKLRMSLRESSLQLGTGSTKQANRSSEAFSISITVIVVSMSFIVLTLPVVVNNTMSVLYRMAGPADVPDVDEYAMSYFRQNLFLSIGFADQDRRASSALVCFSGVSFPRS
ncbi:C-C chemokine receptor type 1-like [Littorina saxatilis]|uniref:C-C chemokine receptor type 1-like n=1 Tax=Littorina saxatilis TaxID=31220 RepID=UPI0038B4E4A6